LIFLPAVRVGKVAGIDVSMVVRLILLWCLWVTVVFAGESVMVLDDTQSSLSAAAFMEVLEDPSRVLRLEQVVASASPSFEANTQTLPSFGRTRSAYWVHFKLMATSQQPWYLLSDSLLEDEYDLFVWDGIADVTARYAKELTDYRRPAWILHLPQQQTLDIYIRATNGDAVFNLPVELLTAEAMLTHSNQAYRLYASVYFGMVILAIYNLFLFFIIREKSYLILSVHIMAMVITMHISNPVFDGIDFLRDTGSHFFTAPAYIAIISLSLFVRQLLQTQQCAPVMDRLLLMVVWLAVVFLPITGWIPGGTLLTNSLALLTILVVFFASISVMRRGSRVANYFFGIFLLVFLFIVPNLLVLVFQASAWNLQSFYVKGMPLGHLVFILLLSLIQAERVRHLREDNERVQAANQAKTTFIATISHELRTPLNAIVQLVSLLKQESSVPQQQDYVSKLAVSATHMLRLINNVLDISKIDRGVVNLVVAPLHLSQVVRDIQTVLTAQASEKGLKWTVDCEPALSEMVLGDATCLTQVLLNLTHNGIKYTQSGYVSLTVERSYCDDDTHVAVLFKVKDSGHGICPEHLIQIYEPFVQVHLGANYSQQGVGLGLAICYRLVQAMGGELQVESEVGSGSCFYFTLRFKKQDSTYNAQETLITPFPVLLDNSPKRILLVDDDEINRFVTRRLLEVKGCAVALAADGQAALDVVHQQAQPFDLVLMDVSMPCMDGYETTRRLRACGYQFPIVALTAHAVSGERERCEAAGMNDFFTKPFELHELEQMVSQWIPNKERG
jgi:signal transduction histidine kinase/ActR/RegA family two-component response regulator